MCEEMLKILGHKGNTNQNSTEISPPLSRNGYHQEHHHQQQMLARTGLEEEPLFTVGGNVN
jgi:hypothetical protein